MRSLIRHRETHAINRIGWLRAAVLGANDGLVSTASLIAGVAAAATAPSAIITVGFAGLVAGAMSMAAGEYVSVSSQSDAEKADILREKGELAEDPAAELDELTAIYVNRGLDPVLARAVAEQLSAKDALGAHTMDELHITEVTTARPIQAAMASAASFAAGAALPLAVVFIAPPTTLIAAVFVSSIVFLGILGAVSARVGGSTILLAVLRVTFWGAIAIGITALVGRLFGAVV